MSHMFCCKFQFAWRPINKCSGLIWHDGLGFSKWLQVSDWCHANFSIGVFFENVLFVGVIFEKCHPFPRDFSRMKKLFWALAPKKGRSHEKKSQVPFIPEKLAKVNGFLGRQKTFSWKLSFFTRGNVTRKFSSVWCTMQLSKLAKAQIEPLMKISILKRNEKNIFAH